MTSDKPPTIPPLLLTCDEAAAAMKLCTRTLDKLIRDGELKAVRTGRQVLASVTAIQDWIASREAA